MPAQHDIRVQRVIAVSETATVEDEHLTALCATSRCIGTTGGNLKIEDCGA
ncbi:MAG: hypothetical protein QNJ44_17900 [Rhodobacter sp.]|nr:hypothetical protein [Rhodobacter sp.]